MNKKKKWNDNEILDIGSVDEDDFDPFGDDDFELESQQHEERKAEKKKVEKRRRRSLPKGKKIRKRLPPTRWRLRFQPQKRRTRQPRATGCSPSRRSLRMPG